MNSQIKNRQRKLTDQVHNTTFQKEKTIMITQQNQIGIYSQLKQEQDKRASKKGIATWQYLFEMLFDMSPCFLNRIVLR